MPCPVFSVRFAFAEATEAPRLIGLTLAQECEESLVYCTTDYRVRLRVSPPAPVLLYARGKWRNESALQALP